MKGVRSSLRWKLTLSVGVLLLVVSGGIAIALLRHQRFFLQQEGLKRARALAENLSANARDPLLAGDELRLSNTTENTMKAADARYAFVTDHRGAVLYHSDGGWIGKIHPSDLPPTPKGTIEAATPIEAEGTRLGWAVVGLDTGYIVLATRATAGGLLLPLFGGTLIAVAGLIVLTGFFIRRIEVLEGAVQSLGAGDLSTRAEIHGQDEVTRLSAQFNLMAAQIERGREQLERGFTDTVSSLAEAIEAKDAYTRGHCERVARISHSIALRLGIEGDALRDLELAAILHDVGKIGVPREILAKRGRLTPDERRQMEAHCEIGARILEPLSFLGNVASFVLHHHENHDGSGYPHGLGGDAIPLPSRIIHVVDAYDAMTSSRPYRSALGGHEALRRIVEARGTEFAPEIVALILELASAGVLTQIRHEVEAGAA